MERPPINDLILGKGQVTPENIVLIGQKDFSYRLVTLSFNHKSSTLSVTFSPLFVSGSVKSALGPARFERKEEFFLFRIEWDEIVKITSGNL